MLEQTVGEFTTITVPTLVNRQHKLDVSLITYNNVSGYNSGRVEASNAALNISVAAGEAARLDFWSLMDWHLAEATNDRTSIDAHLQEVQDHTRNGQAKMVEEMYKQPGRPDVMIIYVGLTGFSGMMRMIKDLRLAAPKAHIAALTCDCNLIKKMQEIKMSNDCDSAIVTPYCGGRDDMKEILEAFINAHNKRPFF